MVRDSWNVEQLFVTKQFCLLQLLRKLFLLNNWTDIICKLRIPVHFLYFCVNVSREITRPNKNLVIVQEGADFFCQMFSLEYIKDSVENIFQHDKEKN